MLAFAGKHLRTWQVSELGDDEQTPGDRNEPLSYVPDGRYAPLQRASA